MMSARWQSKFSHSSSPRNIILTPMDESAFVGTWKSRREVPAPHWSKNSYNKSIEEGKKNSFTLHVSSVPQSGTAQCQERPHGGKENIMSDPPPQLCKMLLKRPISFLSQPENRGDQYGWMVWRQLGPGRRKCGRYRRWTIILKRRRTCHLQQHGWTWRTLG